MSSYLDSRLITLNSNDAVKNNSTYNSDVNFNFKGILKEEPDILQVDVDFINCQIPVSFYMINANNNILNYTLATTKTIVLTQGNYNSNSIIAELNNQFNNNGDVFTITLNAITGKLNFKCPSLCTFNYSTSSIMKTLGFNASITSVLLNILSPFTINLQTMTQLAISSNTLASYSYSSKNNNLTSNVMTISIDKPPYGLINYYANKSPRRLLRYNIINSIDIQIKDQNGFFVNFNNCDWNLTFSINILRKMPIFSNTTFNDIVQNQNQQNQQKPLDETQNNKTDNTLDLLTTD